MDDIRKMTGLPAGIRLLTSFPLFGILALAMSGSLGLIFFYAPTEREMGVVQRIFYFHVPSALISFLAFFVVCVASILFLATGKRSWDILGRSSAELGVLFCTLVLVTGPLWAKPIWNTWWTWEVRLTTTLILWMIYIAYLMVRNYAETPEQGARFAAVLGIVGFLDVPIIWISVRLYRGLHPTVFRVQGGGGLEPAMRVTFFICLGTFLLLYLVLLGHRARLGWMEWETEILQEETQRNRAMTGPSGGTPALEPGFQERGR